MYIVRWLMVHPIIATWVLAVVAILLMLSSGSNSEKEEVLVVAGNSVNEKLNGIKADIRSKLGDGKILSKEVLDKASIAVEAETVSKPHEKMVAATKSSQAEEGVAKKLVNNLNVLVKTPPFSTTSVEGSFDDVQAKPSKDSTLNLTSTAVADLGQSTTEEMLLMAREAYWNNGLDEAAQIYEKLIEVEPKVLEHRGELGNVYWRQGYPKKAAELYSEIAIPMIEQGGKERVANMIGFIGLFYPDRAAEIHKQIQLKK